MTYVAPSGSIPVCFITPDCARAATGIINKSTAKSADNAACFFPECMFLPPLLRSSLRRQAICRTEHFCGQRGPFFYRRGEARGAPQCLLTEGDGPPAESA